MGLHDLAKEKLPISEKDLRAASILSKVCSRRGVGVLVRILPNRPLDQRLQYLNSYSNLWVPASEADYTFCLNYDNVAYNKIIAPEPEIIYD